MKMPSAYHALALQIKCRAVSVIRDREEARGVMSASLQRIAEQIPAAIYFIGADTRLVVLPEYFLTGFPMKDSISAWAKKACLEMDGPEYDALGKIAQASKIYLAGNAYEVDPKFPDLYFQTCFLIEPSGNVILRYRRLNSMFAPTPHDIWEKYLDTYGLEGVFPVARTTLGNFAAIASEETMFPEIARCLMMRGAEIFFHPTSQANETTRRAKDICTLARAIENCAYVISCNTGGVTGTPIPEASADGGSMIVDYQGTVLVKSGCGESMSAFAEIDLSALRRFRRRSGMANLISRQRFEAYSRSYAEQIHYPANNLLDLPPDRNHFTKVQQETIERLAKMGII